MEIIMTGINLRASLILLGILFSANIFAANLKEAGKELKGEIKSYNETNILPQLNDWKADIDKNLKTDDLTKLNKLRTDAYNLKMEIKKNILALKNEGISDKKEFRSRLKEIRKESMGNFKDIAMQLKPIIEANSDYFDDLFESAKPVGEKWRKDLEAITEKWREKYKDLIDDLGKAGKDPRKGMDGKEGRRGRPGRGGVKEQSAKILLWNGIDSDADDMQEFSLAGVDDEYNMKESLNYPNPFKEKTNITFNLPSSGNVKITINNENGKVIDTIQNGFMNAGNHTLEYAPKIDVPSGLYFYRIKSEDTNITGKLLYRK